MTLALCITVVGADGRRYWTLERAREDWELGRDFKVICVAKTEIEREGHISKNDFAGEVEVQVMIENQPPYGTCSVERLWNSHDEDR